MPEPLPCAKPLVPAATAWPGRLLGGIGWSLVLVYFVLALGILALRYAVLPNIESHRGQIERLASDALGLPVSIGQIEAGWQGLHPELILSDVRIADQENRPALQFRRVETVLSWTSLLHRQLRLRLLLIEAPELHIRRDGDGHIFVAGIALGDGQSNADPADWLLAQERLRIRNARVVWEDALRKAPPLALEAVNFALDSQDSQHRFGLTAQPPAALAARIDVRGDLRGDDLESFAHWQGRLYAELDYADLAGWHPWVDYPVALPRGRGGLRSWIEIGDGRFSSLIADVALNDVQLRLARHLPELQLASLSGRLSATRRPGSAGDQFSVAGLGVRLQTRDGIELPPTDYRAEWQAQPLAAELTTELTTNPATPGAPGAQTGQGSASRIDLAAMARLAAYLPLDAATREQLRRFSPRGELSELQAHWQGDAESLQRFALTGKFSQLGLDAVDVVPGFTGISGHFAASEQGGELQIDASTMAIDLPRVLPVSPLRFDRFAARVRWQQQAAGTEITLESAEFGSRDAAGSASGRYTYTGNGPGLIDLQARIDQADARAVWRYLPHVVNAGARNWVRDALREGRASDARLTLRGDLARFPFLDGDGEFHIGLNAHNVTVDYAPSWPRIDAIDARVTFAGAGMKVEAQRGRILNTRLSETLVTLPDFDAAEEVLLVRGRVDGPTAEFLRFIELSPVAISLDHATSGMRAEGPGRLDLALKIPLRNTDASVIDGHFQFLDNRLSFADFMPPLTQLRGQLDFTGDAITVKEASADYLGGSTKIQARTEKGRVAITAQGQLQASALQQLPGLAGQPALTQLQGSTTWRASLGVRTTDVDVRVESELRGIRSQLPPPYEKASDTPLALVFERTPSPQGDHDRWSLSLTPTLTPNQPQGARTMARIERRRTDKDWSLERGILAIGAPSELPRQGLVARISLPEIDIDRWQALFNAPATASNPPDARNEVRPLDLLELGTARLQAFGHQWHGVSLRAQPTAGIWRIALDAREAAGEALWDGLGRGALRARLKKLALNPASTSATSATSASSSTSPAASTAPAPADSLRHLPEVDLIAEEFSLGGRRLGRLEARAQNAAQHWQIDRLLLTTPEARLSGTGGWKMLAPQATRLDFTLDTDNAGKLLDRLGFPDSMRQGQAQLKGALNWPGPPTAFAPEQLSGHLRIEASRGQFAQLDPGAGRLLALISLQSLPRRISLDFRDIFSEGFAFDRLAGDLDLQNGLMRTEAFEIDGAAARIEMRGQVDLKHETQDLNVSVLPELGGTAALGIGLVNPVAGVATLLAHKVLQNPLNRLFAFNYHITGAWDEPKVEKTGARRLSPETPP